MTRASGPWNPGIVSPVPPSLAHLCTIFRPENTYTSYAEARELRGLTGLDYTDLVAFRPERLALHELLIRVTADFSVPDGQKIEDLGINFRRIVSEILARHLAPGREQVEQRYAEVRARVADPISRELRAFFDAPATP